MLASISATTRLPMTQANGEITWQATSPRIPRISTMTACGWSCGGNPPYGGAPYWFGGQFGGWPGGGGGVCVTATSCHRQTP